jgi:hypothetical protein
MWFLIADINKKCNCFNTKSIIPMTSLALDFYPSHNILPQAHEVQRLMETPLVLLRPQASTTTRFLQNGV